jgi:3-oxoacyl-(acyl-carrier-protein) synthase/acyl-CoA thioesterase FadM/NAD(P)-dependent dehydrogenase (short-subunit alcohol dehydrogenase family)
MTSAYFAIDYTIHFDDTMAYGGHHFLTSFKFQCAAREAFLFGERIFDLPGVKESLDRVHLLTSDAYARNLQSLKLGDRVAILLTLEDWGRASARFCYRVIDGQGEKVCAGFQTLICADASTGNPIPLPTALRDAMDTMRQIEETQSEGSFRDSVLAGGNKLDALFGAAERLTAVRFLSQRYPHPQVIAAARELEKDGPKAATDGSPGGSRPQKTSPEAWVFAGQGAFDAELFKRRIDTYTIRNRSAREELAGCASVAGEWLGKDSRFLIEGSTRDCVQAVETTPGLSQVAIHLQNVLGARLRLADGLQPSLLMGHSFGELAAFHIGGCCDLLTSVRMVCLRAQTVRQYGPPAGGLLAAFCERHRVKTEIKLLGLDRVFVAGRNHDRQTILTGPVDQLERLKVYLKGRGIGSFSINSPTSFHHPQLQQAASYWLDQLRRLAFQEPAYPIYTAIGRRFITPTDDIATVLSGQLLRPFDLQGAILDVAALGITTFVDCGSAGSLAALITQAGQDGLTVWCAGADRAGQQVTIPSDRQPKLAIGKPTQSVSLNAKQESGSGNGACRLSSHAAITPNRSATLSPPVTLSPPAIQRQSVMTEVGIVGQGCILPGAASSPDRLLAAIMQRRTGIVDQRQFDQHWSEDFYSEKLVADRSTSHLTGRVDDADITAPAGIDPAIFNRFTRTQQLLCIALAPCLPSLVGAQRVTCLIGATADGFEDQDEISSLVFAGIDPTDEEVDRRMDSRRSANRTPHDAVQEVFDRIVRPGLEVTLIDAACASSLYSVALGMRLLENGLADAVISGGVFCPGPGNSCLFSQFRGTTSTGCRPFDAGADGVVFSEGAALVTLRRTVDAERLGLSIAATVKGVGLSSDGRSSSANVPQTRGQILCLQRCYDSYAIDPAAIGAIEAHGTSTPVGDSTELETLRQFFAAHVSTPIPIHSLKATLGHAGWAAGTASVIAVCEYLRTGVFPGQACHQVASETLKKSADTLRVTAEPIPLIDHRARIAIDGFGFGGANAHLVLERYRNLRADNNRPATLASAEIVTPDDPLVIVAHHQLHPTRQTPWGPRFDRDQVKLPKDFVVLPELADDMDISQTLAVILANDLVAKVPNFDETLRRDTAIVLAMGGKTHRGVEATMRVMSNRLRRYLDGHHRYRQAIDAAFERARPSKAYTLQCMMPNVAAGRAALLLNLNGPNFVVDSGASSLKAAFQSAALLLRGGDAGGTRFAIVSAIHTVSSSFPAGLDPAAAGEYSVVFGVTRRSLAERMGWTAIADLDEAMKVISPSPSGVKTISPPKTQIRKLVDLLDRESGRQIRNSDPKIPPARWSIDAACRIHVPVWVEKVLSTQPPANLSNKPKSMAAVVPADAELAAEMVGVLPPLTHDWLIVIVGESAHEICRRLNTARVLAISPTDIENASPVFEKILDLKPEIVSVVQRPRSWDFLETLSAVSNDNSLCEFLFLLAQHSLARLNRGEMELWSLVVDGWRGLVHPQSGGIAGLLKSIQREIPAVRTGSICTRGGDGLATAMRSLLCERQEPDREPEVVYDDSLRLVRRLRPSTELAAPTPQVDLKPDSVVVASGGARGVTAVMLDAILRDYRCAVIALGRSPMEAGPENPDRVEVEQQFYRRFMTDHPSASPMKMKRSYEAARARWETYQTIRSLSALGGRVEYKTVDMTDRKAVGDAIAQIADRYGKIDLLIHGAGVQVSKRLEDRSLAEFRQTYGVKVSGLDHLVRSCFCRFGKIVPTHVLTSAYSIFGNDGQHDYGAANETMDRVCEMSSVDGRAAWSSIAWLAWNGIGMTRGSEYRALAKRRNLTGVDRQTGQRIFRVVMSGQTGAAVHVPVSDAEHVEYQLKTVPSAIETTAIGISFGASPQNRLIEEPIDLSTIECLPFHRVRNVPTLPGAWIVERMVHVASKLLSKGDRPLDVTVEDLSFVRFVRCIDGQDPNVRVVVEAANGSFRAWIITDVTHPTGRILAKDVLCAQATLTFGRGPRRSLGSLENLGSSKTVITGQSLTDPYCRSDSQEIALSGPFDCLSEIVISSGGREAWFVCDANCVWCGDIPALLLDAAFRVGAMHASGCNASLFVPVKIRRMVIPVESGARFSSESNRVIRSTSPRLDGGDVCWERTEVLDEGGQVRMTIEDAFARRLP